MSAESRAEGGKIIVWSTPSVYDQLTVVNPRHFRCHAWTKCKGASPTTDSRIQSSYILLQ